eukprot:TRINITY_DN4545_c0_g1_i1.p2 TRINITY_DN4545_c0_g1~~TRINITY_DN4545_c0_g1_i1.p2  ORF type:complete len:387 (-),score=118.35 TRINITY_DN4545_c0_g1_i1:66-1226(-)
MASTTYQDTHTENVQVQELVVFLVRLDGGASGNERMAEYKALVSNNQLSACMNKLASESDLLFAKANDTGLVSFFALFSTLLLKLGKDTVEELLPKVIATIASSTERKHIRLQILGDIFNLDANTSHKVKVLNTIFKYAVESDQIEAVQSHITALDDWVYELNLDNAQLRTLIASILPGLQNSPESRDLVIRYLSTFKDGEKFDAAEEALVKKVLVELMKAQNAETTELDELLDSSILSELKGSPEYELLTLFSNGNCEQYKAFVEKNQAFFSESGIDAEISGHSIALATFSRICAFKKVVTYAEVAEALKISEDEVEPLAIDAVMQGLVDARLDQPQKTILVKYARQRSYGKNEWTALGERVEAFKTNILDLVKVLEETKATAHH